jgi:hypothetical protein
MKYVCLVQFAPEVLARMSAAEKRDLDERSLAYDEELLQKGHLILAQALQAPETAVLVKARSGKISTTDGPFTETKEQLGGFIVIEARDLNAAIRIAGGIPLAQLGTIEVRPILELSSSRAPEPR